MKITDDASGALLPEYDPESRKLTRYPEADLCPNLDMVQEVDSLYPFLYPGTTTRKDMLPVCALRLGIPEEQMLKLLVHRSAGFAQLLAMAKGRFPGSAIHVME